MDSRETYRYFAARREASAHADRSRGVRAGVGGDSDIAVGDDHARHDHDAGRARDSGGAVAHQLGDHAAQWREFRRVRESGHSFIRDFERASSLEDASAIARRSPPSPFTRIFTRAVNFLAEMKPGALRSADAHDS